MNYVISINHEVKDLGAAQAYFLQHLGFTCSQAEPDWAYLENGALAVKLMSTANENTSELRLNVNCADLDEALAYYSQHACELIEAPDWHDVYFQRASLLGPHKLRLTLIREYDEDELNILPELPMAMDWQKDALSITQHLLKSVPVSFRDSARLNVTETAEAQAVVDGKSTVDLSLAMQTLVRITPDFQHARLQDEMRKNSINPDDYFAEN